MGCIDCQRRPRSLSPSSVLPTPSPSPTPLPPTVIPNGFHHQLSLKLSETKNGLSETGTKNWENEIDASQHSHKSYKDSFDTPEIHKSKSYQEKDVYSLSCDSNGVDLSSKGAYNGGSNYHLSPTSNRPMESAVSAFRSIRKDSLIGQDHSEVSKKKNTSIEISDDLKSDGEEDIPKISMEIENKALERTKHKHKSKNGQKPYNPLDVCNLTSKDPPKARHSPKRRHLNPIYNSPTHHKDSKTFPKPWSPSIHSMFSSHHLHTDPSNFTGKSHLMDMDIDYSVPITTTYLKHMRNLGFRHEELMRKVSDLI